MLNRRQRALKRMFDLTFSILGILFTFWLIVIGWILAAISTKSNGLFIQKRIGQDGRPFNVYKLKTMNNKLEVRATSVTTSNDIRITKIGGLLRKTKIDELPQLFNVLTGRMSFVGPRPDVPGFADQLIGKDRCILTLKPGITGPASLKYRHEEDILAAVPNPEIYNSEVIWPDKVELNIQYMKKWSLKTDILYILKTIYPTF